MNKILTWVDYGKISFPVGKLRVRISSLENAKLSQKVTQIQVQILRAAQWDPVPI